MYDLKTLSRHAFYAEFNSSVAVSWEPPNSSENIIVSKEVSCLQVMSQRAPPYNDKQCEFKRTVLTCGSHEAKVLRIILAFFTHFKCGSLDVITVIK